MSANPAQQQGGGAERQGFPQGFMFLLVTFLGMLAFAFIVDIPGNILPGFIRIMGTRSILMTDYVLIGGIGAAIFNAAVVGTFYTLVMYFSGAKANGAIIMGVWVTVGFAFFGKNLYTIAPLVLGVWLFAKYNKDPFTKYALAALLVSTVSPAVTEIGFMGRLSWPLEMLLGVAMGFLVGFIFPPIAAWTVRVHDGYNLYNGGFAGGFIAAVLASILRAFGWEIVPHSYWSEAYSNVLAIFLYLIAASLLCIGLFVGDRKENIAGFLKMTEHSGRLVTDFHFLYGNSIYINMAALCAFSTTLVLVLGGTISGPVVGGVLTIVGFATFGKHLKNVIPIMTGAAIATHLNIWPSLEGSNLIAILFGTCLAPIAGAFGWKWGIVAGFLHIAIVTNVGVFNGGLNLYNNGFAAGFVAMLLLPIITLLRKDKAAQ